MDDGEDEFEDQDDYRPIITTKESNTEQNRIKLFRFLAELDRYCISDATEAALSTVIL